MRCNYTIAWHALPSKQSWENQVLAYKMLPDALVTTHVQSRYKIITTIRKLMLTTAVPRRHPAGRQLHVFERRGTSATRPLSFEKIPSRPEPTRPAKEKVSTWVRPADPPTSRHFRNRAVFVFVPHRDMGPFCSGYIEFYTCAKGKTPRTVPPFVRHVCDLEQCQMFGSNQSATATREEIRVDC